jgi:AraC-like DNA-binding protein
MFFSLSNAALRGPARAKGEPGQLASSLVFGVRAHHSLINTGQLQSAMGVCFRPGGARAFLGARADALYDEDVPLEVFWGLQAAILRDRLQEARGASRKFHVLETALLEHLDTRHQMHVAVRYALAEFARLQHTVRVADLAKATRLSRRQFTRLFSEQVGLPPTLYRRLLRFQGVLGQIASGERADWADLALARGYYDQAHLSREFRDFSGISPGAYVSGEQSFEEQ